MRSATRAETSRLASVTSSACCSIRSRPSAISRSSTAPRRPWNVVHTGVPSATASRFIVPEQAIDAQSLIAYADLVVSAGGTMNREAVALGTPVWTTFQGRLGAVDERLIAEGRLRTLGRAEDVVLAKRAPRTRDAERIRRDPALLAALLMRPVARG